MLIEETPGRSARRLPSVPVDEDWRTIAGAVSPVGVADCVDCVGLPTIAGTTQMVEVVNYKSAILVPYHAYIIVSST